MTLRTSLAALLLATAAPVLAQTPAPASPATADAFVADAEARLAALSLTGNRAAWVNATHITDDTDWLVAKIGAESTELQVELAKGAARFDRVAGLSPDTTRKLGILKQGLTLPAPVTPGAADELNTIATRLQSTYGKGRGTLKGVEVVGNDLEAAMGTTRDPALTAEMWASWHKVGQPMKADYTRMVAIANAGARDLGYADVGAMWRSGYDMPPEAFAAEVDRIWAQVKPLYNDLHCDTRAALSAKYGDGVQKKTGPIRADLLGNMWAQEWGPIYDVVVPAGGGGGVGFDTTQLLVDKGYDPLKMVQVSEGFYTSLGLDPLPKSFYERSQIVKPAGREVVCHASAWNLDNVEDLRIKMCTKVNATDFVTVHHELGHNYYQRAYNKQPYLYLNGANDGFHEAIGDFVALSITPQYLVQIGLLDAARVPPASADIGLLHRQAMDKVAFLPFGLLIDKWRWGVFDGSITPANYNAAWTKLRLDYQGITPPVVRSEADFDPGAKFHIPGNTPYMRYFLARVLQFQFYEAACKAAGWRGPLHRCSFYGNKAVGAKLNAMLELGASKPWPDALEAFTGTRKIDGGAMLRYFKPLQGWLKARNKGRQCGW